MGGQPEREGCQLRLDIEPSNPRPGVPDHRLQGAHAAAGEDERPVHGLIVASQAEDHGVDGETPAPHQPQDHVRPVDPAERKAPQRVELCGVPDARQQTARRRSRA